MAPWADAIRLFLAAAGPPRACESTERHGGSRRERSGHLRRLVSGAVVDHENLERELGLVADEALDRLREDAGAVAGRDDDAELDQSVPQRDAEELGEGGPGFPDVEIVASPLPGVRAESLPQRRVAGQPLEGVRKRCRACSVTTRPQSCRRKYCATNESAGARTRIGRAAARYSASFADADVRTTSGKGESKASGRNRTSAIRWTSGIALGGV